LTKRGGQFRYPPGWEKTKGGTHSKKRVRLLLITFINLSRNERGSGEREDREKNELKVVSIIATKEKAEKNQICEGIKKLGLNLNLLVTEEGA